MQFGANIHVSDPWLAGRVRSARVGRYDKVAPLRVESLPDGTMTLLFRRTSSSTGDLSIAGPRTRALFKTTDAVPLVLALRFAPGTTSQFLGVPAHALTDRIVRFEQLWGAEADRLLDTLLQTEAVSTALDVLAHALHSRTAQTPPPPGARLARRAVRVFETRGETLPHVETVANALGISSRHLRRVFIDNIGLAPKDFIRSTRLQRAIAMAGSKDGWAEIAADAGYYDQAHLINDFRDLMGVTPGVFARRHVAMQWPRRCLAS